MTNEYDVSKKKWLEAIKRWQAEWRELVAETGIVPEIRGTHGIMLVSGHGMNGPADLRLTTGKSLKRLFNNSEKQGRAAILHHSRMASSPYYPPGISLEHSFVLSDFPLLAHGNFIRHVFYYRL